MGHIWTDEQRRRISEQAVGMTIAALEWDPEGQYWVMTFSDNSEMCFRFMAELVNSPKETS